MKRSYPVSSGSCLRSEADASNNALQSQIVALQCNQRTVHISELKTSDAHPEKDDDVGHLQVASSADEAQLLCTQLCDLLSERLLPCMQPAQ